MVLKFSDFVNEKMGVLSRLNQDDDIFGISKHVNLFMSEISRKPDEKYKTSILIIDTSVEISYEPVMNPKNKISVRGEASKNGECVKIYERLTTLNYLDVKYTLIHELTHCIQLITKKHQDEDTDTLNKIKDFLVKPTLEQVINSDSIECLSFMYLLYKEDLFETYAWCNNAYQFAYLCKMTNLESTNQEIVKRVLDKLGVSNTHLNNAIEYIKNDENGFDIVISTLVGNFSELSKDSKHRYFDKEVFKLPVVRKMKRELYDVLHSNKLNINDIVDGIVKIINDNMEELHKVRDIICDSFFDHLKYWFKYTQKRFGKSIQLGIDDVEEYNGSEQNI